MRDSHDRETSAPDALAELSQELRDVQWLGLEAERRGARHVADHWAFEPMLVVVGALLGVALYFWVP